MDLSKFKAMRKKPGILALAVKGNTAELLIYDIIGEDFFGDGVTAKSVVEQLTAMPENVDTITVRINSPGGDVFDGVAIFNALAQFKGRVNVQVDGVCASIASVIAMSGDSLTMAETASLMIHNPWTLAMGDSSDMRATADLLDKLREGSMLPAYARSGIAPKEIIAIMDAETWYTAAEAKAAGWIDGIKEMPTKPSARVKYDLSAFKHAPAAVATCTCDCAPCVGGDCELCDHEGCDCEGCDCPMKTEAKAEKTAQIEAETHDFQQKSLIAARDRELRLRLAEYS